MKLSRGKQETVDIADAARAEREALWKRVGEAAFLTDDEKRQAVGYGLLDEG
jgi:phage portal protein BeeE